MIDLGFNEAWPTTLYLGEVNNDSLLDRVCETILTETNIIQPPGDFQNFDILSDGSAVFQEFRDTVVWPAFAKYLKHWNIDLNEFSKRRIRSWITGSQSGYMIPVHNHSGASISAVFYLLCEDQTAGGELLLMDPRHNANRGYDASFKPLFENINYLPKSGEFVLFPGFVYHHTIPFRGKIRLAMPVDLFLDN